MSTQMGTSGNLPFCFLFFLIFIFINSFILPSFLSFFLVQFGIHWCLLLFSLLVMYFSSYCYSSSSSFLIIIILLLFLIVIVIFLLRYLFYIPLVFLRIWLRSSVVKYLFRVQVARVRFPAKPSILTLHWKYVLIVAGYKGQSSVVR